MDKLQFLTSNPDYPLSLDDAVVRLCDISDLDIPSGYGGINGEGYTYSQLRHHPIIPELISSIDNSCVKEFVLNCNARNQKEGFTMYKVNHEYCFWGLRVGPVVKAPSEVELRKLLADKDITTANIRQVTYDLLRAELSKYCDVCVCDSALIIGNMLDCAPHEDISGYIFMVPNWAHKWFIHRGYVSQMKRLLSQ